MSREWADLQVSRALNKVLGQLSLNESEVKRRKKYRHEKIRMAKQQLMNLNPLSNRPPRDERNLQNDRMLPSIAKPIDMGAGIVMKPLLIEKKESPVGSRRDSATLTNISNFPTSDRNGICSRRNNNAFPEKASSDEVISGESSTFNCRSRAREDKACHPNNEIVTLHFPPVEITSKNGNFGITFTLSLNDNNDDKCRNYYIRCEMEERQITEVNINDVKFINDN